MGRSADVPRAAGGIVAADGDDTGCTVLHVDMDAFFASIEIRRCPELRARPVIVGGGTRGVVAAASYEARRYGVRSAMPIGQAVRLCPRAVVIRPDHRTYAAVSAEVMAMLRDVTPVVEPLSLDEAFLDVTGALRTHGRPAAIAAMIRARMATSLRLTCSVGVAPSKFVAKLASSRCKPDGLLVVPAADVLGFLEPLPVTVLAGVGARTAQPLHRLGVRTVRELADVPLDTLRRAVGVATANHLHELACGRDPRSVHAREPEKSISADRTSDVDMVTGSQVERELLRLAGEVGARLRQRRLVTRTVGIKIRFADFRTVTRARTLVGWVDTDAAIYDAAAELYRSLELDRPRVRLVGVKCENLHRRIDAPEQLLLAAPVQPTNAARHDATASASGATASALDLAGDAARARFGSAAVRPATLLRRAEPEVEPSPRRAGSKSP